VTVKYSKVYTETQQDAWNEIYRISRLSKVKKQNDTVRISTSNFSARETNINNDQNEVYKQYAYPNP
jgi:hypothetical protein